MKITVLGSGGWGTALALVLLENGHEVTLWSYTQEESDVLRNTHENPMLKGVPLPETLQFSTDLACVKGCGAVVLATPSFAVRTTAAQLRELAALSHPSHFRFLPAGFRGFHCAGCEKAYSSKAER